MTPITEDQVVALMDGCARREREALKVCDGSRMRTTGKVLRFARGDVVTLDDHRATSAVRRTVSGMFFYVGGRTVRA